MDESLDHTITNEEYTAAKQKIINRRVDLTEALKSEGNNWLGRFKQWILEAHQAKNIATDENLDAKRSFVQKIGSDFRLTGQKASWLWANPWKILAENSGFALKSG